MRAQEVFWTVVGADLVLLGGLLATWIRPSLQIWPPPSGRSWQFAFNWILFPVVYIGVGLLPFLDPASRSFGTGPLAWGGLLLFSLGLLLALWGVAALGWVRSTGIPGSFRVAGPYRMIRNPQYTGIIAAFLGWGLWTGSGYALVAGLLHALWYALAPFLEERALRKRLGVDYEAYLQRVPRFLPGWRMFRLLLVGSVLGLTGGPRFLNAQEVRPRITLAGRGLVSLNTDVAYQGNNRETELVNDFSDTYFLLRLDRKLYGVNRGQVMGTVLGFTFPDADSRLGQIYFDQAHVFWWSQGWELVMGRSRLENFVLEFPTLRDDDLVDYAYVLNAFTDAPATEYHLYGNVTRLTLFQHRARWMERIQLSNLAVTDRAGNPLDRFGVQMASVEVAYRLPDPVRFTGRIRKIGIRYDVQQLDDLNDALLHAVTVGLDLNLTQDPLANWELRLQGSFTPGVDALRGATLQRPWDLARARSYAAVASLSFLRSPYQVPRLFFALTGAYRAFPDQGENRAKVVAGIFYQVGAGMDVGLQYEYERVSSGLQGLLGFDQNHALKLLFAFEYETMFNDYFMDRETILNLEHGFAP